MPIAIITATNGISRMAAPVEYKKVPQKKKSVQLVPIAFTTATNGIRRMVAPVEEKKGQQKKFSTAGAGSYH